MLETSFSTHFVLRHSILSDGGIFVLQRGYVKDNKQSLFQWLRELNPRHQLRVLEMLVGTSGGVVSALILHYYVIPEDWPINGPIWILVGLVGLYFGYAQWRDSW